MSLLDDPYHDEVDWEAIEQEKLERTLVKLSPDEAWETGAEYKDPGTGELYWECVSCGKFMDQEDCHSGGECNYCHAIHKDD